MDGALSAFLAGSGAGRGVAVVALGSYARRELCPVSDVDLLLLHDGWRDADLKELVTALCYPLWDAGLSVGHAVRTPKEAVKAAGEALDAATAISERRLVAGDRGLFDDLASRASRWLRAQAPRLLADLAAADAQRHARAGADPGRLEPDLKDGAGGLRDLASLRWAAACLVGEVGLDPLVGARYLSAADRGALAAAAVTLLEARCALHLVLGPRPGGAPNLLRLDLQDDAAERLGLTVDGRGDGDELLRRVGLATRLIAHRHARTWPRLLADAGRRRRRPAPPVPLADGLLLHDGLVELAPGRSPAEEPSLGLRAVAAAAVRDTVLGRHSAEQIARTPATLGWDEPGRAALLELLRAGHGAVAAHADADQTGLLGALLPEWGRVRGRPQRNPLHRYDLDSHAIHAAAALADVAAGSLDPAHAEIWERIPDRDAVVLGTWLHDVGKGWEGDHCAVGAPIAARWVAHMGFEEPTARTVGRLVRLHLLLPDAAVRRDLDDPAEIATVAEAVGDQPTLDALYLLSLADARATGPAAYSPWRDELLARLHAAVSAQLSGGEGPESMAVPGVPGHLLQPPPAEGEVRVALAGGNVEGTTVLAVAAVDRPGLVAGYAGVLAGHGVPVLAARIQTRGHTAADTFVLGVDRLSDPVVRDLRAVAADGLDVAALVAARERRREHRPPALAEPVAVAVHVEHLDHRVRVEVRAPDVPGLLYRVAATLTELGLDVRAARVTTLGPEARDVFDVSAASPVDDDHLVRRLTEVLTAS